MAAAALLTTRRLLLVAGNLRLVAAVDATGGALGVAHAVTSMVWAGPALLYITAGGQVRGRVRVCECVRVRVCAWRRGRAERAPSRQRGLRVTEGRHG